MHTSRVKHSGPRTAHLSLYHLTCSGAINGIKKGQLRKTFLTPVRCPGSRAAQKTPRACRMQTPPPLSSGRSNTKERGRPNQVIGTGLASFLTGSGIDDTSTEINSRHSRRTAMNGGTSSHFWQPHSVRQPFAATSPSRGRPANIAHRPSARRTMRFERWLSLPSGS
jgi:hypothetical protein